MGSRFSNFDQLLLDAKFTVAAESNDIINVAIQLIDRDNKNDLAERGGIRWYLSDDANGDSIASSAPSGGIAIGTDGVAEETTANKAGFATSESDGDIDWIEGYINTGVAIFSKEHRDIFKYVPDKDKLWMDLGYDDVFLGWRINEAKHEIQQFHPYLNFMSMFTEPWSGLKKSDAEIIHYAGMGHHPNVPKPRQIENDFLVMKKYGEI